MIGVICYRDHEVMNKLQLACKKQGLEIVNLLKNNNFSVQFFKKIVNKKTPKSILLKLYSNNGNQRIFQAIKKFTPNTILPNSIKSIKTCEYRNKTFKILDKLKVNVPRTYYRIRHARAALRKGKSLIVKLDTHHAKQLSKRDRMLGVISKEEELIRILKNREPRELFFQEYLGTPRKVHKAYIIKSAVISLKKNNRYHQSRTAPDYETEEVDREFKKQLLKIGRELKMQLYGVDYLKIKGRHYIIDVNDFPSYNHAPKSTHLLSEFIKNISDE